MIRLGLLAPLGGRDGGFVLGVALGLLRRLLVLKRLEIGGAGGRVQAVALGLLGGGFGIQLALACFEPFGDVSAALLDIRR